MTKAELGILVAHSIICSLGIENKLSNLLVVEAGIV